MCISYMYISKSKAGAQYLDSLSGRNDVSDEGHYKSSTFLDLLSFTLDACFTIDFSKIFLTINSNIKILQLTF